MMRHTFSFLLVHFGLLFLPLYAWSGTQVEADSLFKAKQYAKALPLYLELGDEEGASVDLLFKTSVCMVYASPRQEKAVEILEELVKLPIAPVQAWFYLGEANRRLYRFGNAIECFNIFLEKSRKDDELREVAELSISTSENGLQMLDYASRLQAEGKVVAALGELSTVYDTFSDAYLAVKPKSMWMAADSAYSKPYGDVVVFPTAESRNNADIIYFSSYGQDASSGLDIYCIRRIEGDRWGEPENLGAPINTSFDEDFPYITNNGKTLYFASKGHYGMGGYDIYKSTFSSSTQKWSTPENLGFPISSPHDDFLFIPDAGNTYACFASARESLNDSIVVYKVQLEVNPEVRSLSDDEALSLAYFSRNEPTDIEVTGANTQVDIPVKGLASHEDYLLLLKATKIQAANITASSNALDLLRGKLGTAESTDETARISAKVVASEDKIEKELALLSSLQSTLSQLEVDFLTGGVKTSIQTDQRVLATKLVANAESSREEPKAHEQWSGGANEPVDAPTIQMKPLSLKEGEKYKFRAFGKSTIIENDPLPKGIVYKIRIGSFTKDLSEGQLKNLSPITTEKKGTTKRYYVGVFYSYDEAVNALTIVKNKGFKDAAIDSWINGRPEQLAKARAAEKRAAQTASSSKATGTSKAVKSAGAFRIMVTVASSYTAKNVPALLSSLSGGKDVVKRTNAAGTTATYSVGVFNSSDDVERVKARLEAEGLTNIEVVQLN